MMNDKEIRSKYSLRNGLTMNLLSMFADDHLHPELKHIVAPIRRTAFFLVDMVTDGPELHDALRKLLDSKDAFIRHYLITHNHVLQPQKPPLSLVPRRVFGLTSEGDHLPKPQYLPDESCMYCLSKTCGGDCKESEGSFDDPDC